MKKIKKIVVLSAVLMVPLLSLAGCTKISLTGSTANAPASGQMGNPPTDGGAPPTDGGIPPAGDPVGN